MNIRTVAKPDSSRRSYEDVWERLKKADALGRAIEIDGLEHAERRSLRNALETYIRKERWPAKVHVRGLGKNDQILTLWLEGVKPIDEALQALPGTEG